MAKVIQPPQINHLDELLDVLVNQDKYIQYMKGLQAMRDGIAEALGVVDTKEKADDHLQDAQVKHQEALELLATAQEEADKIRTDMTQAQAQHQSQIEAFNQSRAQTLKDLDQDRRSIADQQVSLDRAQADLQQREQALRLLELQLQNKSQVLTEKEARLNKLKAALGEAGI